ncbi:MAG: hypothetical protein CME45_00835 [Halieaceae bacterium]|nr:hypothetical protein [Halieaceae bacterium]
MIYPIFNTSRGASSLGLLVLFSFFSAALSAAPVPTGSPPEGMQPEDADGTVEAKSSKSDEQKSWLITPTLSADPKMGTNVGGVIAYVKQFGSESTPSMLGLAVSYSDTDSISGGIGAQLYWGADSRRLTMLLGGAEINNEYDDFLGTGQTAETQDSMHTVGFRYLHQLREGGWFAGIQGVSTNYAVGADGLADGMLNLVGLSGFDATGLGLVLQHDTMDQQRAPESGHLLTFHNFAYREGLGGESSFDVGYADLRWYRAIERLSSARSNRQPVIALQIKSRFTSDAPLSGYSWVSLPGYTMGNYLSQHFTHFLVDGRFPLSGKLGLVAFGGVGCQFGDDITGRDIDCKDNTYPSVGVGVSYVLDEAASILIRLELAKGKSDNEAIYLRFGHSF